ncbi:MAG: hypothetical protein J1F01_02525 [Oscillospiraceae bacterium]|nr:hypothetical protein [Oscillospiraceae bacterium]
MNTNTNTTYNNTIQELFINAACSYSVTAENQLGERIEEKTKDSTTAILDMISEDDKMEADELMYDVICEYKEAFYIEGFRKAINLILDAVSGGGNNE